MTLDDGTQIFERWMDWHPPEQPWLTYIKFELRYNEVERARSIYERCTPLLLRFVFAHSGRACWVFEWVVS